MTSSRIEGKVCRFSFFFLSFLVFDKRVWHRHGHGHGHGHGVFCLFFSLLLLTSSPGSEGGIL